jgi:O-antigen/teichoic acid export membrane protein
MSLLSALQHPRPRLAHFLSETMAVIVDQGLYSLVTFLSGVMVARSSDKTTFGIYALYVSISVIALGIQNNLLITPFNVFGIKLKGRSYTRYLGSSFVHNVVFSALVAIVIGSFSIWLLPKNNAPLVIWGAVASGCCLFREFVRRVVLSKLEMGRLLLMSFLGNGSALLTLTTAYLLGWLSLPLVFAIFAFTNVVPAIVVFSGSWFTLNFDTLDVWLHLRKNFLFGRWLLARTAVYWPAVQVYPWLLAYSFGPGETASYAACLSLASAINPLLLGLNGLLIVKAVSVHPDDKWGLVRFVRSMLLVITVPIIVFVVGLWIWGSKLLGLFYGNPYSNQGSLLFMFGISVAFLTMVVPVDCALNAMQKPEYGFRGRAAGALISLLIGIPLTLNSGAFGAGVGYLMSNLAYGLYAWYSFVTLELRDRSSVPKPVNA